MKRSLLISIIIFQGGYLRAELKDDVMVFNLERALNQALNSNFEIRRAAQQAQVQHGVMAESRALLLPQVRAAGSYTQYDEKRPVYVGGTAASSNELWAARVEVTQSLFVGGTEVAQTRRDMLRNRAAFDGLKAVINDVMSRVHEQFYRVLLNKAKVVVSEQSIELLREELASEKKRFEAGTVSSFNVLRAEVELANAQTPLIRARHELKISLENFRKVLGLEHDSKREDSLEVEGALTMDPIDIMLAPSIDKALAKRPELQKLEKLYKAESANVWKERSGVLPQVNAFGAYDGVNSDLNSDYADITEGWDAGVRGEWRFFNSGATLARVHEASALRNLAEIDLHEARLDVEIEVRRSYFSVIEAAELVKASEKVVEQAEESLRLAQSRFDAGVGTQLEVLDTQVALTDARTNRAEALYGYNVAVVRFRRAMGDLIR